MPSTGACCAKPANSIKRFLDSGVTELGDRLGPLLWQFAPTKQFDAADFGGFLELLPKKFDGHTLRHVIEVRHDSFRTPEFIALLRAFAMPVVFTDHAKYPNIADVTGDFVYARLQRGKDTITTAYPPKEIAAWAGRLQSWAQGKEPADLAARAAHRKSPKRPARRLCLRHSRGQNPRPGWRNGADCAADRQKLTATCCETARVHPASSKSQLWPSCDGTAKLNVALLK